MAGWGRSTPSTSPCFYNLGFAIPMLVGTVTAAVSVVIALSLSPETKGKVLVAELSVA
ncbi:MAG TPA: hypothetical protein VH230_06270 [Stellaceae bacterium]|jgi:hypothetical protein|nr:hypothetical protein [Stellaceae bacterium]